MHQSDRHASNEQGDVRCNVSRGDRVTLGYTPAEPWNEPCSGRRGGIGRGGGVLSGLGSGSGGGIVFPAGGLGGPVSSQGLSDIASPRHTG